MPSIVQQVNGSNAAGTAGTGTTLTLPVAPTAGNLLVIGTAVDKSGAFSAPGFTAEVNLLSASVSLQVLWKVADGTETSVSVTRDAPDSASLGDNLWYAEISDPGTGAWTVVASATFPDDGSNVTSRSTGTTGPASADGLALGFWTEDSYGNITAGTETFTNGYTAVKVHADNVDVGGSGNAAQGIIAQAAVLSGATTESTLSWSGSANQTCGAVVAFGRVGTAAHSGSATGSLTLTGSATGSTAHAGTTSGALALSGTATGATAHAGTTAGALVLSGTASGSTPHSGQAAGDLLLAGTATGATPHSGTTTGGLSLTGTATGRSTTPPATRDLTLYEATPPGHPLTTTDPAPVLAASPPGPTGVDTGEPGSLLLVGEPHND